MILTQQTALVTGATSGIGLATTKALLHEGAKVIGVGSNADKLAHLATELGAQFVPSQVDLGNFDELTQMTASLAKIDIFFGNAGLAQGADLGTTTSSDFDKMMNVNVKANYFIFQGLLEHFNEGARIVFTSSAGHESGRVGDPLYLATKAALRSFGRSFAAADSVLERHIRVNVVSPGMIKTPLTAMPDAASQAAMDGYTKQLVPMQRMGTAEEVAQTVLFLVSPASSYLTGSEIFVDGGMSEL